MKFMDFKIFDQKDFYFCYSKNLYKFLRFIKSIEPIDIKLDKKTNRKFSVFVKCDALQICLEEWKQNKELGKLVFPKTEVGEICE